MVSRKLFLVFGIWSCLTYRFHGEVPAKTPLRVSDLLAAAFERVTGPAYGGACLDVGPPGSWYSHYVWAPTVHYDGELYRMWFSGGSRTSDPATPYGYCERIGLATSRDGIHWTVANGGKPVLDLGAEGSADCKGLAHPYVLRVDHQFMMWYGAIDGTVAQDLGQEPGHVRIERIALATSPDGVNWEKHDGGKPVLEIGPPGSIDSIQATGMHVLRIKGQFVMWYGAYNGLHTFGIATSPDGIRWCKGNHGLSLTGLDGNQQLGPSVYSDGSHYFLLYNKDLNRSWATFAADSNNGIHWRAAYRRQPLLGPPPDGNFGTAGKGRNHSVHPSQMIRVGNRIRVWYGAEDGSPPHYQRIGLMEARLANH